MNETRNESTPKTWQKKKEPTDFQKTVGLRIRKRREHLAMSTEMLAESLGLSTASIIQYELGIRSPSIERFAALAKKLDVTADFLLRGETGDANGRSLESAQLVTAFEQLLPRDRGLVLEIVKTFLKASQENPAVEDEENLS